MAPKGYRRAKGERVVKTTVDLPEALWRAAKIRAMDERTDLRSVIITALDQLLKSRPRKGGT
jgi:hypothetical protein